MQHFLSLLTFVSILFLEPRTSILGPHELFIEAGSTINLTCAIQTGGQAMHDRHIYWKYNDKVRERVPEHFGLWLVIVLIQICISLPEKWSNQ